MPKTCKLCTYPIFSKGLCLRHDREVNREKYQIKRNVVSSLKKVSVTGLKQPRKIKQVSDKQKVRLAEYKKVRDQFMLAHPVCQAMIDTVCTHNSVDLHHRAGRIGDLLCESRYFLAVCRQCHEYLETHPKQAKEWGFSVDRL